MKKFLFDIISKKEQTMQVNIYCIVLISIIVILIISLYGVYVSLIQKRNKVQEAFASVDVQLTKRYDLIPNILKIAAKFMEHEKSLIEDVTKLRTEYNKLPNTMDNIDKKIEISKDFMNNDYSNANI